MQAPTIPNKFQMLIESTTVQCYAEKERIDKSIILSQAHMSRKVLPAIVEGARLHTTQRKQSILRRANPHARPQDTTVEALYDSHFRKQRNFGPTREAIYRKVAQAAARKEPITLVSLMFTRKNVCTLKRNGDDIAALDLAEILSLVHLNSFAELIAQLYPFGVQYIILSEGTRFARAFNLENDRIRLYQSRLLGWAARLGLHHLKIMDYEHFLLNRISQEKWEARLQAYEQALAMYRARMEPIFNPTDMTITITDAIKADPIHDAYNPRNNFVPLWDSIKNSLPYPAVMAAAKARGIEYTQLYRDIFRDLLNIQKDPSVEELRHIVLQESWSAAIEHNARVLSDMHIGIDVAALLSDSAFRATINPKPGSAHLGIYSVRETTSRVQPWHGTAYLRADNQRRLLPTVLSKLEIESRGGIPVCVDNQHNHPFFYADADALELLQHCPVFNMSTR